MSSDIENQQESDIQLVSQAIRARNLGRLRKSFESSWVTALKRDASDAEYQVFKMALANLNQQERRLAFQWTCDCYHPLMSPLGKALQEMDGFIPSHF